MEDVQGTVYDDQREACVHHWLIDEKNYGVCKKCGVVKRFSSAWDWGGSQRAWASKYSKGKKSA
jgi:hypothetical protein